MQNFWGILIIAGFATMAVAQFAAMVVTFALYPLRGLFALFVPGFLLVALKDTRYFRPIMGVWICGVLAIVAGTIALA